MAFTFRHRLRVEFADTDLAGIVHFASFFRYMEVTEHAFLRSLGLSVHIEVDGRVVSWPRVHAECSFKAPLRFEDEFDVDLTVREKKRSTIVYGFRFRKDGSELVAVGSTTTACVAVDAESSQISAISIPKCIDQRIDVEPEK